MKEHKEESSIQIKKNVRLLSTTNFLTGYLELNFLVRNRPNATTLSNEAFILHKEDEREKLMERYRYKEIERKRVRVLKNAVKRKKKCMREREKQTRDIIYFGLWQNYNGTDASINSKRIWEKESFCCTTTITSNCLKTGFKRQINVKNETA